MENQAEIELSSAYQCELWAANEGIEVKRIYSMANVLTGLDCIDPIEPLFFHKPDMIIEYLEEYARTRPKLQDARRYKAPESKVSSLKINALVTPLKLVKKDETSQTNNESPLPVIAQTPIKTVNVEKKTVNTDIGKAKKQAAIPKTDRIIQTERSTNKKIKQHINDQVKIPLPKAEPIIKVVEKQMPKIKKQYVLVPKIKSVSIASKKCHSNSIAGKFKHCVSKSITEKPPKPSKKLEMPKNDSKAKNDIPKIMIPTLPLVEISINEKNRVHTLYNSDNLIIPMPKIATSLIFEDTIDNMDNDHVVASPEKKGVTPVFTSSNNTVNEITEIIKTPNKIAQPEASNPALKLNSINYIKVATSYNGKAKRNASRRTTRTEHKVITDRTKSNLARKPNELFQTTANKRASAINIEEATRIHPEYSSARHTTDPYSLTWSFKILKNFYNIQCDESKKSTLGLPLIKVRKINSSKKHL